MRLGILFHAHISANSKYVLIRLRGISNEKVYGINMIRIDRELTELWTLEVRRFIAVCLVLETKE